MQIIQCNDHAHLVSKAGSVISSKSPSRAFRWSGINTRSIKLIVLN